MVSQKYLKCRDGSSQDLAQVFFKAATLNKTQKGVLMQQWGFPFGLNHVHSFFIDLTEWNFKLFCYAL